jgi:hypothetical protein
MNSKRSKQILPVHLDPPDPHSDDDAVAQAQNETLDKTQDNV